MNASTGTNGTAGIQPFERIARPDLGRAGIEVFAVEDRCAQLVWHHLPEGPVTVSVNDGRATVFEQRIDHPGGPGAAELTDLHPSNPYRVTVRSGEYRTRRSFHTLAAPPGAELARFATISDLHIGRGERNLHGHLGSHEETGVAKPDLAAQAALDAAHDWGARLVVAKGDLADQTYEWVWDRLGPLLAKAPMPVRLLPGNHDAGAWREFEPEFGAARFGLTMSRGVEIEDLPGVRLVLMDSCIPGTGWGTYRRRAAEVADAVAGAGPSIIMTHHQPQRFTVPTYWPHGVPAADARRFLRIVRRANPVLFGSNGHTHRNRRRVIEGVPWTCVAATNHYPGVWAGYVIHEGGFRQVVRRIVRPDALAWQEQTRHVLRGVWAVYSVGTLTDRCFTLPHPR